MNEEASSAGECQEVAEGDNPWKGWWILGYFYG